MQAVRVHEHGGPEALRRDDVDVPEPGPGELRVRVEAAGVNFIDVYHRTGAYPLELPATLGSECAGTVDAVGSGVTGIEVGQRVGQAGVRGAYAEHQLVPADQVVVVPDEVGLDVAAAVLLQGMTAHYLSHDTWPVEAGQVALVHAAAGGVGHLLTQLCKLRGAEVVATCSTDDKAALATAMGADRVVVTAREDFVEAVQDHTDGRGVDVVYDGVGQATFMDGLDCLRPRGLMTLYGQASGRVDPVDPQTLNDHGSLFLTRPTLFHHVADPAERDARAADLFGWIAAGDLDVRIDQSFPLDRAGEAHRYLEGRNTHGKVLLVP